MKLLGFVKKYSRVPIIDSSTFSFLGENPQNIRCEVQYWLKKGYLIQLKRGMYVLSDDYRKKSLSMGFIANNLLEPSYVSLEYALGYYDLIPEKVTVYTSVTTKKTTTIKTPIGIFEYRSVKAGLFNGFTKKVESGEDYFIASPEKAVLDFFYLRKHIGESHAGFESFRFQNLEQMSLSRFNRLRLLYDVRTNKIARSFIEFCRSEHARYRKLK